MADSYGLSFKNSSDRVILDSEFTRISVLYSGRYINNSESGNASVTTFPSVITTQEQPMVFIRPDSANGVIGMSNLQILGSPGAWTGFIVRIFNMYTVKPNGRWFCGNFAAQPLSQYGLRMWDASNKLIFDSGTPSALFVRSNNSWTYAGSGQTGQGVSITYFNAPFNLLEDEYLLINNLTMGSTTISNGFPGSGQIATMWNYPARTLTLGRIQVQNAIVMGLTVMVARMTQQ